MKHSINCQFELRTYHGTAPALVELTDSLYSHLDNHETIIGMNE